MLICDDWKDADPPFSTISVNKSIEKEAFLFLCKEREPFRTFFDIKFIQEISEIEAEKPKMDNGTPGGI